MRKNRFLPDTSIIKQHDTPAWVAISLGATHRQFADAIAQVSILTSAQALGVGEALPAELEISGRRCTLPGDAITGWYLAETADHHEGPQAKIFYLLPLSARDLDDTLGLIPSLRFEDTTFDEKFVTDANVRTIHWYVMGVLAELVNQHSIKRHEHD